MSKNLIKSVRTPNSMRPAGARNRNLRAERQRRREEAAKRQAARDARSPAEQLARLDAMLGVGVGATRERARLAAQLAMEKATTSSTTKKGKTGGKIPPLPPLSQMQLLLMPLLLNIMNNSGVPHKIVIYYFIMIKNDNDE